MKKILKLVVTFLSIALLAAGCSGGQTSAPNLTLKVWMPFEDSENLQPIFNAYQQKYPNVSFEYAKKNIATYESDLLNALAAGQGPDIFAVHNSLVPKYLNKTVPATDKAFILKDFKNAFVDVVAQDFVVGNKIYGAALSVESLGLYYNKDLLGSSGFATPATTWDELQNQVRRMSRLDRNGYFTRSGVAIGTGSSQVNRAVDVLYLMMLQRGTKPWTRDNLTPTFADTVDENGDSVSPGAEAIRFYTSFADPSSDNYTWNSASDYSIDAFANGRAAYLYGYSFTRDTIVQKAPNLNFEVAPVPVFDSAAPVVSFANYWGLMVNKQTKNANYAWDFIKFATSKEMLDKYYAIHKQPSSRKDLITLQQSDPEIGVFAEANLTAKQFYRPDGSKVDSIFDRLINDIVTRGLEIEETLNSVQSQVSALVQNNK